MCGYKNPTNPGYQQKLEWLRPRFKEGMKVKVIHSDQCPYVVKVMNEISAMATEEFGVEPTLVELPNCQLAQDSPNPNGIFSIIWNGELVADHPISKTRFKNIMNRC